MPGAGLCLKFEKDWETGWAGAEALAEGKAKEEEEDDDGKQPIKPGFMVNGSRFPPSPSRSWDSEEEEGEQGGRSLSKTKGK